MRKHKLLILALVVLLGFTPLFATDYYVKNGGNDAASGLDDDNAWETIAKVNGESFSASDNIYFKCGSTWREQLTVPDSGDSNDQITFGAYGTGADPIINGADLVGTWTEVTSGEDVGTKNTGTYGARALNDLTYVPVTTTVGGTIQSYSIYLDSGQQQANHMKLALYTDNAGSPSSLVANTTSEEKTSFSYDAYNIFTVTSGATLSATTDYWIAYWWDGGYMSFSKIASGLASLAESLTYDGFPASVGSTYSDGFSGAIYLTTGDTIANQWQAACTTEPNVVWFNGTGGTLEADVASLSAANEWFWTGNVLSVYSTSDPDTAYTDPGIESATREKCIYVNTQDYITIDGLNCRYANHTGFGAIYAYSATTTTSIIVQNCTIPSSAGKGVYFYNGVSCIADGNTISDCWNGGYYGNGGAGGGVQLYGANSSSNIVRFNKIEDCYIGIAGNTSGSLDAQIYYNLVVDSKVNGINHSNGNAANPILIYNNVVIHNPDGDGEAGHGIVAQTSASGFTCKNNIVYVTYTGTNTNVQGINISATNFTGMDIDNNLCYKIGGSTADIYKLAANVYNTLAAWQAGLDGTAYSGGDDNGLSADPLMTDPDNDDFTLQITSPCIDAGTDVSLTEDYNSVSVPLRGDMGTSKSFINVGGNLYIIPGAATEGDPDIGAYEYIALYKIGIDGYLYLRLTETHYLRMNQPNFLRDF